MGATLSSLRSLPPGASGYAGAAFETGDAVDDRRRPTVLSVNGATAGENNFRIDGMDNNERFVGNIVVIHSDISNCACCRVVFSSNHETTHHNGFGGDCPRIAG